MGSLGPAVPTLLYEDTECGVCYQAFSRQERVPRVLHCRHTFCTPCLETMSRAAGVLLTVPCPLCRRVTCVQRCVGLQGALWVNGALWDCIPDQEEQEEEEEAEEEEVEEEVFRGKVDRLAPAHVECDSSRPTRTKLKLPAFFKKFSLLKTQMERAVPGGNVEMRSWRRLATDDSL